MSDFCIICLTEAVTTEDWYYNKKSTEFVCPWCVKDNHKIKDLVKTHDGSDYHARQIFDEIDEILDPHECAGVLCNESLHKTDSRIGFGGKK